MSKKTFLLHLKESEFRDDMGKLFKKYVLTILFSCCPVIIHCQYLNFGQILLKEDSPQNRYLGEYAYTSISQRFEESRGGTCCQYTHYFELYKRKSEELRVKYAFSTKSEGTLALMKKFNPGGKSEIILRKTSFKNRYVEGVATGLNIASARSSGRTFPSSGIAKPINIAKPKILIGTEFKGFEANIYRINGNKSLTRMESLDQNGFENIQTDDYFGRTFASGDFNNDGFNDLVVSATARQINGIKSGAFFVFLGSSQGLLASKMFDQSPLGLNEEGDNFGGIFAVGDYNNDGFDDLAVGVPNEQPGNEKGGAVFLYKGGNFMDGVQYSALQAVAYYTQTGLDNNESDDFFGSSLCFGDFDGDGFDDLAVGNSNEGFENLNKKNVGVVFVFKGLANGLQPLRLLHEGSLGRRETNDYFGISMSSGDINNDGKDELFIKSSEPIGNTSLKQGALFVYRGHSAFLLQQWTVLNRTSAGEYKITDDPAYEYTRPEFYQEPSPRNLFGSKSIVFENSGTLLISSPGAWSPYVVGQPKEYNRNGAIFEFNYNKLTDNIEFIKAHIAYPITE